MIVRAPRPDRYAIIGNDVLRDKRLSFRARGVLTYLLSMPDNWQTSSERIAKESTEGRDAIRAALRELESAGYLVRRRYQDDAGRWKTELLIWDHPTDEPALAGENLGENCPTYPLPKTGFQSSVFQSSKEEPKKNDLQRKSYRYFGSSPRICGNCDGTGWRSGGSSKLTRCECGDGLVQ